MRQGPQPRPHLRCPGLQHRRHEQRQPAGSDADFPKLRPDRGGERFLIHAGNDAKRLAKPVQRAAQVGIGDLEVTVPPNVVVRVQAHVGAGTLENNTSDSGTDTNTSSWNVNDNLVIPADTAHPQGTIVLVLNVGIGDVSLEESR